MKKPKKAALISSENVQKFAAVLENGEVCQFDGPDMPNIGPAPRNTFNGGFALINDTFFYCGGKNPAEQMVYSECLILMFYSIRKQLHFIQTLACIKLSKDRLGKAPEQLIRVCTKSR